MNFSVKTIITNTTKEAVLGGFSSTLFLKIAPPFPKLKLMRYDGCEKGDEVHLQLDFFFYKTNWISVIVESGATETKLYFTDIGTTVPAPIKSWQHRHIIWQKESSVVIEDNVTYGCGNKLMEAILFIPFYLLFLYRKPIYKRYFHNPF